MIRDHVRYLLMHELATLHDGERQIAQMLPELVNEAPPGPPRVAFQEHERETREQISNLERCFELLGGERPQATNPIVQGMAQAREAFKEQTASDDLLALFDLLNTTKMEHYEIVCYRGTMAAARLLGEGEVAGLLEANLRQEEEMASKAQQLLRQMLQGTSV